MKFKSKYTRKFLLKTDKLCQEKLTSWVQGRTTRKISVPVPRVGFALEEDVIHIDLSKPKQFDQLVELVLFFCG